MITLSSEVISEVLRAKITDALSALGFLIQDYGVEVVVSGRPDLADYQWNGALALAKQLQKSPQEIAVQVVEFLQKDTDFSEVSSAGPGFVNLRLSESVVMRAAEQLAESDRLLAPLAQKKKKIAVDYGGPNVAKPLHVGHMRSAVIGNSLIRLMQLLGHEVLGDVHQGDWGTQMGMVIIGIQREQPDLPYFDELFAGEYPTESPVTLEDLGRIYPFESGLAKTDPEAKAAALKATLELQQGRRGYLALWGQFAKISLADAKRQYERLGIIFDYWHGESYYNDMIPGIVKDLLDRRIAKQDNGATIIPVGEDSPPLILLKSDGAYLYATTDIATIVDRTKNGFDESHYVVDKRQGLHFEQVFDAGRQAGYVPEDQVLTFHGFGTLNGEDGKPFKSRDGGVMRLEELIDTLLAAAKETMQRAGVAKDYSEEEQQEIAEKVAVAALKFGDLSSDKKSDYKFDPARFASFEGKTGPSILYTIVRLRAVLRKAGVAGAWVGSNLAESERALLLVLLATPKVLAEVAVTLTPHTVADHLFSVAQAANRFYEQCRIMQAAGDEQVRWIAVTELTERVLVQLANGVLGMPVPSRM